MSRDFTTKEKILLVILLILVLGVAYYWLIFVPCRNAIEAANADRDATQTELLIAQAKEAQLKKMQSAMPAAWKATTTPRRSCGF